MLVKEVEPIDRVGVNLLEEENPDLVIDGIIELPLRKPCKIFMEKGIQTCMSSANKNNILSHGEKPIEKEDVYGAGQEFFLPRPTFDDAGKGYAWIMIDFDSLSDENKDWLFSLEERKGANGENIGGRAIWFVHPCELGNIYYDLKLGKYDTDFLRNCGVPEDQIPKGVEIDKKLLEFEKRHIVLAYGGIYPMNSVFLRMPLTEETTVKEVEHYFTELAKSFRSQVREKEPKEPKTR